MALIFCGLPDGISILYGLPYSIFILWGLPHAICWVDRARNLRYEKNPLFQKTKYLFSVALKVHRPSFPWPVGPAASPPPPPLPLSSLGKRKCFARFLISPSAERKRKTAFLKDSTCDPRCSFLPPPLLTSLRGGGWSFFFVVIGIRAWMGIGCGWLCQAPVAFLVSLSCVLLRHVISNCGEVLNELPL